VKLYSDAAVSPFSSTDHCHAARQSPDAAVFFETRVARFSRRDAIAATAAKLPHPMANLDLSTAAGLYKGRRRPVVFPVSRKAAV